MSWQERLRRKISRESIVYAGVAVAMGLGSLIAGNAISNITEPSFYSEKECKISGRYPKVSLFKSTGDPHEGLTVIDSGHILGPNGRYFNAGEFPAEVILNYSIYTEAGITQFFGESNLTILVYKGHLTSAQKYREQLVYEETIEKCTDKNSP